ncbi:hypothetical protein MKG55_002943, partial [Enterococcus faecalis]|nr:hypothetical protein [Enterococcus faecalis]
MCKKLLEKLRETFWTSYLIVINQIIDWFKAKSNKIEEKNNAGKFIQSSLSPKILKGIELKRIMPYIKRINDGVKNPDVTNIALMGSYGSGKSTIIKNFEILYPNYKVLNLSLGSYSKQELENQDENGEKIDNIDDLNEKLENSLVKQMIYR